MFLRTSKLFDFSVGAKNLFEIGSDSRWRAGCLASHSPCERDGGANRDRTDDLKLAKLALSQLSYGPVAVEFVDWMVGLGRLELPTSRLSSARSNQLSYKPDEASSCARTKLFAAADGIGRET